ncbi:MAG: hypothetical protein ACQCN4_03425 [Candidatus Bathyarchaeia archaeon]|jgi:hypothetical protein
MAMMKVDWKLVETVQKKIRVTRVEARTRYVDAVDLAENSPFCLSADSKIDLGKLKRAKIYQATIKVYETEYTAELERHALESALGDYNRLKALQTMKASGYKPHKYELIAIKH